jgi:hypothetical protein
VNPFAYAESCVYCGGKPRHCGGWGKCEEEVKFTVDVFVKEIKTYAVEADTPDEAEEKALDGDGEVVGVQPMDSWLMDKAREVTE